jgi:hypothetical protein
LSGLAAKIRLYHAEGVPGLCTTWRRAYQFVCRRGYPSKWWRRPLALAALRNGTPLGALPRALRIAAGGWSAPPAALRGSDPRDADNQAQ